MNNSIVVKNAQSERSSWGKVSLGRIAKVSKCQIDAYKDNWESIRTFLLRRA